MTLVSVTAYHSFGGEVEASNTPTIRRLTPSCRHQLPRIALRALDEAIEPVSCPTCGIYQPEMAAQVLREQHGRRFDPNEYAAERIKFPAARLWRAACKINTKEAYSRFIKVWPTLDSHGKKKISELRYPPHMRKLVGRLDWHDETCSLR
jgi:hypothetical protein